MICLEAVSKAFNGRRGRAVVALDRVSLQVDSGDFVTIIGPSGSGKSTLLFVIGTLMEPTAGRVRVADDWIYQLSAGHRAALRRRSIGFVFQTFNLIPYLSCLENVALPAIFGGCNRREAFERADAMLGRLGLSRRLTHRPDELSVGERQRVALGRSLVNEPAVLLADEPTGNLDPALTDEVVGLLLELNAAGQTIVMATHEHRLAELGKRVVELRQGRIEVDRLAGRADAPL